MRSHLWRLLHLLLLLGYLAVAASYTSWLLTQIGDRAMPFLVVGCTVAAAFDLTLVQPVIILVSKIVLTDRWVTRYLLAL